MGDIIRRKIFDILYSIIRWRTKSGISLITSDTVHDELTGQYSNSGWGDLLVQINTILISFRRPRTRSSILRILYRFCWFYGTYHLVRRIFERFIICKPSETKIIIIITANTFIRTVNSQNSDSSTSYTI